MRLGRYLMKKYLFLGRIFPNFPKRISYPVVPSIDPTKGGTLGFDIQKSIVTAELSADHIESPETALKSAEQAIQGLVDAYSFINGETYEVRLEAVEQNGETKVYKEMTLEELSTEIPVNELPKTDLLMAAALEFMNLRLALSNFKKAKRYTAYTGLYIYLAIENIKKYFYPEDLNNEGQEWEGLRKNLSLAREDIDFAKGFADLVRHGKYQDVKGTENTRMITLGAEVIVKFYKHLSNQKVKKS